MNGFYIDESGNNGYDIHQPVLVYGGILVPNEKFKTIDQQFKTISAGIRSKIESQIGGIPPKQMNEMKFFRDYEIHSKAFIDGDSMYSKVEFEERYNALEKILKILVDEKIFIYCSVVNKHLYKTQTGNKHYQMHEMAYKELLNLLNTELKTNNESAFLTTDNGREEEMNLLSRVLNQQSLDRKVYPDLQIKDSQDSSMIQIADIIVFIVSVFYRNNYGYQARKKYNYEIIDLFNNFFPNNIKLWEYK